MKPTKIFLYFCVMAGSCLAGTTSVSFDSIPLHFESVSGPASPASRFLGRAAGYSVHVDTRGVGIAVAEGKARLEWLGANSAALLVPEALLPGRSHYFLGSDPARWRTNIRQYGRVRVQDLYDGVDVVYYGKRRRLEFDVVLSPGVDPSVARFRISGVGALRLEKNGDLIFDLGGAELRQPRPRIYQKAGGHRRDIPGHYVLHAANVVGFVIDGEYDRREALIVDPVITYSTFLGGGGIDGAQAIAVDTAGNVFVTGETQSTDFPVAGYQSRTGVSDPPGEIFVTKLNAAGTAVLYSAYIGGSKSDIGKAIAVDSGGNAYVAGHTQSPDFPVTLGAFQSKLSQDSSELFWGDAFVLKLNASGSGLVYSTYLGGEMLDEANSIALGPGNEAFVAGRTESTDFPTTEGAYQTDSSMWIGTDGFVTRLDREGKKLVYSTYLGGKNNDAVNGIAVDGFGAAYVTGVTLSDDFPIAGAPFQAAYHGGDQFSWYDGFVTKLANDGATLVYSTYIGGARHDIPHAIAVDSVGNAYIAGETNSTDFPTTITGEPSVNGDGGTAYDGFVAKLDNHGSSTTWARYLGGSGTDLVSALALDTWNNVIVAGETDSMNFPVRGGDCDISMLSGKRDAFVSSLANSGGVVIYSMFLGGREKDRGTAVAVGTGDNVYVAGRTFSSDFPTTPGVIRRSQSGEEAFVARVSPSSVERGSCISLPGVVNAASYESGTVSPGEIVTIYGKDIGPPNLTPGEITADKKFSNLLVGTRVYFDGAPAPLIYVYKTQLSAVVPYGVAGKDSTVISVEYHGNRSNSVQVPVADSVPAIFSLDSSGRGQGAILNWPDYSVNGPATPVARGGVVMIYATGEGITNPPGVDGQLALSVYPKPVLPVSVRIGGIEAEVQYAGAAPGLVAGAMQVNVRVPSSVAPGDEVPVILKVGDKISQVGITMAVR